MAHRHRSPARSVATLALAGALIGSAPLVGCAVRAPIPAPREPLAATPGEAVPGPPEAPWPETPFRMRVVRRTLGNGLEVVLSRGAPNGMVAVAFVSTAVTRWDRATPPPISLLMGDTMLRATRLGDSTVVDDHVERAGFTPEVLVGADGLTVLDRVLAEELPAYLDALDLALRGAVFREGDLRPVLDARIERWDGYRLTPDGILDERLAALLYAPGDPRATSIGDRIETLGSVSAEDLARRHADVLDPARATLIVVGDVEPLAALPEVGRRFGAWPAHPVTPDPIASTPRPDEGPRGFALVSSLVRSYVKLVERAPPLTHADHAAFLVLEQLLGAMFGARLNLELRERDGVSYGFHASYAAAGDVGELELVTAVDNAHTARAVARIVEELRRVRGEAGEGIEPFELSLAKTRAWETLLGDLDTSVGLAAHASRRVAAGMEPASLGETLRAVDALDADDVSAAARRWIRPDRAPLAVVGSAEVVRAVSGAGVGELRVVEAPTRRPRR